MKIYHNIPYSKCKNLGAEYNAFMKLIGPEDSACFTDGDVMFLTPDFGHIIYDYAERYPDAVLTARTNRIHHLSKQLEGDLDEACDVRENIIKAEGQKVLKSVTEIFPGEAMSGFLMVVPKKVWTRVPFVETGKLLGVDSQFRIDLHNAFIRIFIMDGLFVFHSYRLLNGVNSKMHLI